MKKIIPLLVVFVISMARAPCAEENGNFTLMVKVENLRNSTGVLQCALYNRDGTLPDENYTKYMRKQIADIVDGASSITFIGLPVGRYAVNILHDENSNGKIDRGLFLPIEGIGFSNYSSIGMANRPSFAGASFQLGADMEVTVKVIYL